MSRDPERGHSCPLQEEPRQAAKRILTPGPGHGIAKTGPAAHTLPRAWGWEGRGWGSIRVQVFEEQTNPTDLVPSLPAEYLPQPAGAVLNTFASESPSDEIFRRNSNPTTNESTDSLSEARVGGWGHLLSNSLPPGCLGGSKDPLGFQRARLEPLAGKLKSKGLYGVFKVWQRQPADCLSAHLPTLPYMHPCTWLSHP